MRAAWCERQVPARDVLVVGTMDDPAPGEGEVRVRVAASGVNPGDVKKRADAFGIGLGDPRIVPHSEGAGVVDAVGAGVDPARVRQRVWVHGAQTYRVFGTAAERVVVPAAQAIPLPEGVPFDVGACLGIPGITAHRALHVGGPLGAVVLVHGAAGAVGGVAAGLAKRAGARTVGVVREAGDAEAARAAGCDDVLIDDDGLVAAVRAIAKDGVDRIIDVAFAAHVGRAADVLAQGGVVAAYGTDDPRPSIPFWPLLFQNAVICLVGSDDVPAAAKQDAARGMNDLVASGWRPRIAARFALDDIAAAHEAVERGAGGRVVVDPGASAGDSEAPAR